MSHAVHAANPVPTTSAAGPDNAVAPARATSFLPIPFAPPNFPANFASLLCLGVSTPW